MRSQKTIQLREIRAAAGAKDACYFVRVATITSRPGRDVVSVPYHGRDLKHGTLRSILRQAEITVDELIDLL
jgi:hypothetical protein